MLIEIAAAVVGAFAGAGLYLGLMRLIGRRPPRWSVLGVAAVAMIAVVSAIRYGWGDWAESQLPERMIVVDRVRSSDPIQPWTLVWPMTQGLLAVDRASLARHPAHPGIVAVDLVLARRGTETVVFPHLVDCAADPRRTARLPAGAALDEGPLPDGLDWSTEAPAALFETTCADRS